MVSLEWEPKEKSSTEMLLLRNLFSLYLEECLFQTYWGHIATALFHNKLTCSFSRLWYFCHSLELLSQHFCCCKSSLNCFPLETSGKLLQGIGWEFSGREDEKKVSLQDELELMRMKGYWVLYRAENELPWPALMVWGDKRQTEYAQMSLI